MKGVRKHKSSKIYFRAIYFTIDKISAKVFNVNYGNKIYIPAPSRNELSNVIPIMSWLLTLKCILRFDIQTSDASARLWVLSLSLPLTKFQIKSWQNALGSLILLLSYRWRSTDEVYNGKNREKQKKEVKNTEVQGYIPDLDKHETVELY